MSSDLSFEIDSRLVNVRLSDGKYPATKTCPRRPVKSSLKLGASKLNPNSFIEPKGESFASGVNRSTSTSLGTTANDKGLTSHSAHKSMSRVSHKTINESDNLPYLSRNVSSDGQVNFLDCAGTTESDKGIELDKQKEDFLKLLDLQKTNKLLKDHQRNYNYSDLEKKLFNECFSTPSLKAFSTVNLKCNQINVPLFAHSTNIDVEKSNADKLKDKEDFLKKLDLQIVRTVIEEQKSAEPEIRIFAQEKFGSAKSISWKDLEKEDNVKTVNRRLGLEKFNSAKSISWKDLEQEADILSPPDRGSRMGTSVRCGVVRVADKLGRLAGQIVDSIQDNYLDYIE